MGTFELAKEYITSRRYKVLDEDGGHIAFRFQMNTIHFVGYSDDSHFFYLSLPCMDEVTGDNLAQIKEKCHIINRDAKLVKLYILNDILVAAAEIYYLAQEDFIFQMSNALKHLVGAKAMYSKLPRG